MDFQLKPHLKLSFILPIALWLMAGAQALADETVKATAERELVSPPAAASASSESTEVVFPDFSKLHDEASRDTQVGKPSKTAPTCRRGGHTYQISDVMYSNCMAENEIQGHQVRPTAKDKGAASGEDRSF